MHSDDNPNNLFSISTNDFKKEACPMCGKASAVLLCQDRQKYVGIVESFDAHAKVIRARQSILFWRGAFICAVTWLLIDLFFRFVIKTKESSMVLTPLILVGIFGLFYTSQILVWMLADHINAKRQAKQAIEQLISETDKKNE
jgi:hypothetical protein